MQSMSSGNKPAKGLRTILGLLVAGTLLAAAVPASAHDHRGHGRYYDRGYGYGERWDRGYYRERWKPEYRRYYRGYDRGPRPTVIYRQPPVIYAPPPVIYAPPRYYAPPPGINFNLSLR